jgi:hypothetical protein
MRTKFVKFNILILVALCSSPTVNAQYRTATDNIIGMDLEQVEKEYLRALNRGDSTYTIHYAEALFIQSEFEKAFEMYQRADALGQIETIYQKRDYQHTAKRLGEQSPYMQHTGYFSNNWDMKASISAFCSNSAMEDFSPFYWKDLLFITSSRDMSGREYEFTRNPFLNVHTFIHDCISTTIPDALPEGLNTPNHDGPLAISEDGNLLIITRNHTTLSSEGIFNLYLDYYIKTNNTWDKGQKFPLHNTEFSVQHPFYCNKDSLLYFSSNVEGGQGGFDLYKSKWNGQRWSEPENLGQEINSPYDEVFPAMSPWGDLIYASNHIETTGGLDLVVFRDGERHLFPEPFNTVHDDFSITFKNEASGYFASNRDVQGFTDDIYVFNILGPFWPRYDFYVEVLDDETGEPLENVLTIFAAEPAEGELLTSEQGQGFLHTGDLIFFNYHFQLSKEGYQDKDVDSNNFVERDDRFILTLRMKKIVDPIQEETLAQGYFEVFFDNDRPDPRSTNPTTNLTYQQTFHSYMLRKDDYYRNSVNRLEELDAFFLDVEKGMEQLQWLVRYLKEEMDQGRDYTIIFTSHASPLATSEYNLILSKRRFASVENFIQSWSARELARFIDEGKLSYENNPFGDQQARPGVSDDRGDLARSVYSVEAARERKVTVSWRRNDARGSTGDADSTPAVPATRQTTQIQQEQQVPVPEPQSGSVNMRTDENRPQQVYHVIVASFTNPQDAQNEVRRLRSLYLSEATVLTSSDSKNYRVSYNSYPSMREAEAALQSIRSSIKADAWILVE